VATQSVKEPKKGDGADKPVACDNHPDREAVLVTDGTAFQVLHLCAYCVPPDWDKDD